jgi:hypothetical protein
VLLSPAGCDPTEILCIHKGVTAKVFYFPFSVSRFSRYGTTYPVLHLLFVQNISLEKLIDSIVAYT